MTFLMGAKNLLIELKKYCINQVSHFMCKEGNSLALGMWK